LNFNSPTAVGNSTFGLLGAYLDNTSGTPITNANNNPILVDEVYYLGSGNKPLNLGAGDVSLITFTAIINVNQSSLIFGGTVSGAGYGLIKLGSGTLVFDGASTYTGTTAISGGTLQFGKEVSIYNDQTASWTSSNIIGGKARNMHKGKRKSKGTGPVAMTAVQGLLERHGKKASKVVVKVMKNRRKIEAQKNVFEYVLKGSEVFTDALPSYNGLGSEYTHAVVDHAERYVDGKVHTNGLENFWCLLKRTIKGTTSTSNPSISSAISTNNRFGSTNGKIRSRADS
jgi:autotransporter-associated beta strand protein